MKQADWSRCGGGDGDSKDSGGSNGSRRAQSHGIRASK
jgi:hypothetical protein